MNVECAVVTNLNTLNVFVRLGPDQAAGFDLGVKNFLGEVEYHAVEIIGLRNVVTFGTDATVVTPLCTDDNSFVNRQCLANHVDNLSADPDVLSEARNPNDATGGWNFRVSVNGNVQTAGSSAGLYVFRNYNDAGPNIEIKVTQATFNDYPYTSPTQGFKMYTGTTYGMQIAATTSQKLAFHGATPTIQAARIGQLTDSSGGTPSSTIAAISDTATKNAIASLVAKLNSVEALMSAAAGGKGFTA